MSEKRFPATPKRKSDARKKGQVLKSQELTSAIMLLAMITALKFLLPAIFTGTAKLFRYIIAAPSEWDIDSFWRVVLDISYQCLYILGPLFLVAVVAAIAVNFLQVGSLFTFEPVMPKLSRLSPVDGFKRMFGLKGLIQMVKSLIKVLIIGYLLFDVIRDNLNVFPALQTLTVGQSVVFLGDTLFGLAFKIALSFLGLALADYLYQWWEYQKNLRMSHEEIKEEYKQTEGDPQVKSQIKKRQRMMAMRRMMEDLKKADVVVTNPTHYAVALKYDLTKHAAPFVVAKGQDEVALKIKEIARENDIIVMENKPLARSLYNQTELGQVIPADLYKAVAEILAFVYKLNKRKRNPA